MKIFKKISFIFVLLVFFSHSYAEEIEDKTKASDVYTTMFEFGLSSSKMCRDTSKNARKVYAVFNYDTERYVKQYEKILDEENKAAAEMLTKNITTGMPLDDYEELVYENCISAVRKLAKGLVLEKLNNIQTKN